MYNKDEVMKALARRESKMYHYYETVFNHDFEGGYDMSNDDEIISLVDAAYKAGRESMYLAGGKACKKVCQNHKEDHLCRFNDGEQNCNCYLSGINEVIVALEALK